jgi:hypothetical protein
MRLNALGLLGGPLHHVGIAALVVLTQGGCDHVEAPPKKLSRYSVSVLRD